MKKLSLLLMGMLLTLGMVFAQKPPDKSKHARDLYLRYNCGNCHAVPAAGIVAKTKNEKMKGGDLGGKVEGELAEIAAYVRKEAELDGKTHKKPFKGTDEELQAIIDWLGTLEAQE